MNVAGLENVWVWALIVLSVPVWFHWNLSQFLTLFKIVQTELKQCICWNCSKGCCHASYLVYSDSTVSYIVVISLINEMLHSVSV